MLAALPNTPAVQRERLAFVLTSKGLASPPREAGEGAGHPRVVASTRGVKRIRIEGAQLEQIQKLPARVASQVKVLLERGWFDYAKAEIRNGRNPADKGWKQVLCGLLIAGGCTRRELELAFVTQLNMTPASAKVQASVGIAVFAAGRLATEVFGKVTTVPN